MDAAKKILPWNGAFESYRIYSPTQQPGFVAWATAFSYGNGALGLSFDEVLREPNPDYRAPSLDFAEAAGIPVSYASVECENAGLRSYRVYMRTDDGRHFYESGRCLRREASFCHAGFPDGRIIGFDVPKKSADGKGWSEGIRLRESLDGGSNWRDTGVLLAGSAPYLWRCKRLRDGTIVLLASLYGTPWGRGRKRPTRNTLLPGESYLSKIQTFFMTSKDGRHFSPPNYILAGLGAHEYDFVELDDGSLLFVAGDVQATPVGRQFVRRLPDGWLNEAVLPIRQGAPEWPEQDPQGGIVPETLAWSRTHQCLVGYRRNKCFSVSPDWGENWYALRPERPFEHLYQPVLMPLDDANFLLLGHNGGDLAFGQCEMHIHAQRFCLGELALPQAPRLELERVFDEMEQGYINAYRARLTAGGEGLAGRELCFRFVPYWDEGGRASTVAQADAAIQLRAVTDAEGYARADVKDFDDLGDIHFAYRADVVFAGDAAFSACLGPEMCALAQTPRRRCLFPYEAYWAGGWLYLAPQFMNDFPEALERLSGCVGDERTLPPGLLPQAALVRLAVAGVAEWTEDGRLRWRRSIHAPRILDGVRLMEEGDWYE